MKLEKKYLEVLYKTIKGTEGVLTLAEGRIRDAFMKDVTEATTQFENDRRVIYEKFCTKTEDDKPDVSDGKYHFKPSDVKDIQSELDVLYAEEVELPDNERIKEIIERTQYKPEIGEAEKIDHIISKL